MPTAPPPYHDAVRARARGRTLGSSSFHNRGEFFRQGANKHWAEFHNVPRFAATTNDHRAPIHTVELMRLKGGMAEQAKGYTPLQSKTLARGRHIHRDQRSNLGPGCYDGTSVPSVTIKDPARMSSSFGNAGTLMVTKHHPLKVYTPGKLPEGPNRKPELKLRWEAVTGGYRHPDLVRRGFEATQRAQPHFTTAFHNSDLRLVDLRGTEAKSIYECVRHRMARDNPYGSPSPKAGSPKAGGHWPTNRSGGGGQVPGPEWLRDPDCPNNAFVNTGQRLTADLQVAGRQWINPPEERASTAAQSRRQRRIRETSGPHLDATLSTASFTSLGDADLGSLTATMGATPQPHRLGKPGRTRSGPQMLLTCVDGVTVALVEPPPPDEDASCSGFTMTSRASSRRPFTAPMQGPRHEMRQLEQGRPQSPFASTSERFGLNAEEGEEEGEGWDEEGDPGEERGSVSSDRSGPEMLQPAFTKPLSGLFTQSLEAKGSTIDGTIATPLTTSLLGSSSGASSKPSFAGFQTGSSRAGLYRPRDRPLRPDSADDEPRPTSAASSGRFSVRSRTPSPQRTQRSPSPGRPGSRVGTERVALETSPSLSSSGGPSPGSPLPVHPTAVFCAPHFDQHAWRTNDMR